MWVRIAHVFSEFLKRHPSVNKREILGDLCRASAGAPMRRPVSGRSVKPGDWRENQRGYWDFTRLLVNMGGSSARSVSERSLYGNPG